MGTITGCKLAMKYMGKSNGGKGGMVINTASIGSKLSYIFKGHCINIQNLIITRTRPFFFEGGGVGTNIYLV